MTTHRTLERPTGSVVQHLAGAAAAAAVQLASLQECVEAAGDDWGALFTAPLEDFDCWLLMRRDALPNADRVLPGTNQGLIRFVQRHSQQCGGGAGGGGGGAQERKRTRGSGRDAAAAPASKSARAVLRAFPARVVATQPTQQLVPELLVGFDPVSAYVQHLEERFGHLAVFCADAAGGFPAVGVKWLPAAFLPTPLRPAVAHCMMEAGPGLVVPNLPQVLKEMHLLGEGLLQDVVAL